MSDFMWSRPTALVAAVPLLLLGACGGDEPKRKPATNTSNPSCQTEGTVEAQPASSLEAAVEPYQEPGHKYRLAEQVSGTAEVQLEGDGASLPDVSVMLVKTGRGWVVTSVRRC